MLLNAMIWKYGSEYQKKQLKKTKQSIFFFGLLGAAPAT